MQGQKLPSRYTFGVNNTPPSASPDSSPAYPASASPAASPDPARRSLRRPPHISIPDGDPEPSASHPFTSAVATTRIVQSHAPAWNDLHRFPDNHISNTKYTLWSFLPLSLYNQCRLAMNKYFLIIAALQLWPYITPVNPVTTWVPLAVIFLISTVKEGVDDYRRSTQDRLANERRVTIMTSIGAVECASEQVQCGDVVRVCEGEEFCADMVLLASSERSGACWIETSNVDGETNLKGRMALPDTQQLIDVNRGRPEGEEGGGGEEGLGFLKCTVECALPNKNIYAFDSTITLSNDTTLPLSPEQLLLQATTQCNTAYVFGLVVYTGNETKVGQNKNLPRHKQTTLDAHIDRTIKRLFVLQLSFIFVWGFVGCVLTVLDDRMPAWYLELRGRLGFHDPFVIPLRFLLLASMMIPISLKVTLDLIKLMYSLWIGWDLQMWDARRGVGAEARNTALAEELGCVEFVLSDKTGTLTENVMLMREMATQKRQYKGETAAQGSQQAEETDLSTDVELQADVRGADTETTDLLRCLMLCNTVVPSLKPPVSPHHSPPPTSRPSSLPSSAAPRVHYSSSSPDELCLVQFAASIGFVLEARDGQVLTARSGLSATSEKWTVLAVCEFSSTRKRMSIVLRDSANNIQLLMKGADDVLIARASSDDDERARVEAYKSVLDGYGRKGLRTLVFATRTIKEVEWEVWSKEYKKASVDVEARETALANVYEDIERDVHVIGVTGIEDKLQADVPETLVTLREAGIRVWMLTGDKQQTAEEIGRSSGLIAGRDTIFYLNADDHYELATKIEQVKQQLDGLHLCPPSGPPPSHVLIVDGATLSLCLLHHPELFYRMSASATSVVCCRCTPSQKSAVAALLVSHQHVALGIGDGSNDVPLLQTASVGIGISGREGTQAARSSDFSITQFSHLRRLLLVHGRWSYTRTAWITQYCLYKSLIIAFVQLSFAFVSRFSGSSFFDSFSLVSYNLFYTSVLGVFFLFEQDLSAETLLKRPQLYATTRLRTNFTRSTLGWWFWRSIYQSVLITVITLCTGLGTRGVSGLGDTNQLGMALVAYSSIVLVQCLTLYLEMSFVVVPVHGIVAATVLGFLAINLLVSATPSMEAYSIYVGLLGDPVYWLTVLLCVTGCVLPVVAANYWRRMEHPTQLDLAQEEERAEVASRRQSGAHTAHDHSTMWSSARSSRSCLSCTFCAQARRERCWSVERRCSLVIRHW